MIELHLTRIHLGSVYTIGRLCINGDYFCDTLEDQVRDQNKDGDLDEPDEDKIYGATAIPYGRYEVVLSYSPKFKRILPELLNVNDFTAIRIHAGNSANDTQGCILVGKNRIKGYLTNSRITENALVARLHAAEGNIYINIV